MRSRPALIGGFAVAAAVVLLVVFGGGLARAPIGPGGSTPPIASATTPPPSALAPAPSPNPSQSVSPSPSPTIDVSGRATYVALAKDDPRDQTFLLAGEYWLVADARNDSGEMCDVVVFAQDAVRGRPYDVQLIGFSSADGSSFHSAGSRTFARATYQFVATGATGPGQTPGPADCSDWSFTLEAR